MERGRTEDRSQRSEDRGQTCPQRSRLRGGQGAEDSLRPIGAYAPVGGQRSEDEAKDTARRAYNKNPTLTSSDIGKAIGRARRTVDSYIADLRAATRFGMDLKIFRMNSLGIPQDRIAKRLGQTRETIRDHLAKMAELPNPPNADLSQGFTVSQVAEKHACPACPVEYEVHSSGVGPEDRTGGWTEPMACPQCLCMDLSMCRN